MRVPETGSAACPRLEEMEFCQPEKTCFHYTWRYSNWSTCIADGAASCGHGTKDRKLMCIRSDGRSSNPSYCLEVYILILGILLNTRLMNADSRNENKLLSGNVVVLYCIQLLVTVRFTKPYLIQTFSKIQLKQRLKR